MNLEIPDEIAQRSEANMGDLLLALAIQLYADNQIDHADACRLSRLDPTAFNRELMGRSYGVHEYPPTVPLRRPAG